MNEQAVATEIEGSRALRPYQKIIFHKVLENLFRTIQDRIPLIGMATGGGKTFTAYCIMGEYLKYNPSHRILVLAHNLKILRKNFQSEQHLNTFELTSIGQAKKARSYQVVVAIPATIGDRAIDLGEFDIVITDEAHENWSAPRVQTIIKDLGSPKQLLLTASHGQFDNQIFEKHLYSVMQGYQEGYLSKCSIQLVNTAWDFTGAFTRDDELKNSFKFNPAEVEVACKMVDSDLRSVFRNRVGIKKTLSAVPSGRLKYPKTMIACHSQLMADDVYNWFKKYSKAHVSISYAGSEKKYEQGADDPIERFQGDSSMDILIVVRKGILGFDCPELECVVDMTGSKNVERTQQLMGRVLRKTGRSVDNSKTYFKVMPEPLKEYTKSMMGAVIAIMHPENDRLWRGQWKKAPIIQRKKQRQPGTKRGGTSGSGSNDIEIEEALLDFDEYLAAFDMRKHKDGEYFEIYADTTLEKILIERGRSKNSKSKKILLLELAADGGAKPSSRDVNKFVKSLGVALNNYMNSKNPIFDSGFTEKIKKLRPDWFLSPADIKKQELLTMAINGEPKPSKSSRNENVKSHALALLNYTSKASGTYDPDFEKKIKEIRPDWYLNAKKEKQRQLLAIATEGGSIPKREGIDKKIDALAAALYYYTKSKHGYDDSFAAEMRKLRPDWFE